MRKNTVTHEEAVRRVGGRGIRFVTRYVDSTTKIETECEKCGGRWRSMPGSLFMGRGCPHCVLAWRRGGWEGSDILEDCGEWLRVNVAAKGKEAVVMLIDRIDYDALKRDGVGKIHVSLGYAKCRYKGKGQLVHRILLGFPKESDHANGNKLDNRRANLRECESWQNQANRSLRKTNTSGYEGVYLTPETGHWVARLMVRGRTVHYSTHGTKEDAAAARHAAKKEHCGEFIPVMP